MRDLIITENITVDGVIDAAEGWFAPGDEEAILPGADLEREIGELKAAEGRDIVCTGSMQLTSALIAAGLVDEA